MLSKFVKIKMKEKKVNKWHVYMKQELIQLEIIYNRVCDQVCHYIIKIRVNLSWAGQLGDHLWCSPHVYKFYTQTTRN